jgi:hypothetical protein
MASRVILIAMACAQACLNGGAEEVLASARSEHATPQAQSAEQNSAVHQWRTHPSYQVFASRTVLPTITVTDTGALDVGGQVKILFKPGAPLPDKDIRGLAEQFGVPVAVVMTFLRHTGHDEPFAPGHLAQALPITIMDYKYLKERWNRYHPPTGQQDLKTKALQALEAGEVARAWEMFCALPVPRPPAGLRIVAAEQTKTLPVATSPR